MHNRTAYCESCKKIVHSHCAKKTFDYNSITSCWQCNVCISSSPPGYNSFSTISHDRHDPVRLDKFEDVIEIRKILDCCHSYNPKSLNHLIKSLHSNSAEKFSCIFNNIDGNASNFDPYDVDILPNIIIHSL